MTSQRIVVSHTGLLAHFQFCLVGFGLFLWNLLTIVKEEFTTYECKLILKTYCADCPQYKVEQMSLLYILSLCVGLFCCLL